MPIENAAPQQGKSSMFSSFMQKASTAASVASTTAKQGVDAAAASARKKLDAVRSATGGSGTAGAPAAPVDARGVRHLMDMGFSEEEAQLALVEVGGEDVEAAAALLCGESGVPSHAFQPGDWVEVQGREEGDGQALNGQKGRLVKFDVQRDGYVIEVAGQGTFVKAEHLIPAQASEPALRPAAAASTGQASSASSVVRSGGLTAEFKRKADWLFSRGSSTAGTGNTASTPLIGARGPEGSDTAAGPASVEQRRAAAEAAERRLSEARTRNAGTMEDWRRLRRDQQMGAGLAGRQPQQSQGAGQSQVAQSQRGPTQAGHGERVTGAPSGPVQRGQPPTDEEEDENEDLQRALAASLEDVGASRFAAGPQSLSPSGEAHASMAAALAEATASTSVDQPDQSAGAPARPAQGEEGEEWEALPEMRQDPELFELQLQQAIAEEELELQQALALSIEQERLTLEQACSPGGACAAAGAGEDTSVSPLKPHCASPGSPEEVQMQRLLEEARAQEGQLKLEQQATEERVSLLRNKVAEHSSPVAGVTAGIDLALDVAAAGSDEQATGGSAEGAKSESSDDPATPSRLLVTPVRERVPAEEADEGVGAHALGSQHLAEGAVVELQAQDVAVADRSEAEAAPAEVAVSVAEATDAQQAVVELQVQDVAVAGRSEAEAAPAEVAVSAATATDAQQAEAAPAEVAVSAAAAADAQQAPTAASATAPAGSVEEQQSAPAEVAQDIS